MKSIRVLSTVLALLWAQVGNAQDDVITGFAGSGFITWTNSHTNGLFNVEWASNPEGPWQASWTSLWNLAATADTIRASVPMFYRVSWSTNVTHDLRITPSETTVSQDTHLVALTASGGDGSYTWGVYDIALGGINQGSGESIIYVRASSVDNAVSVQSAGHLAYAVIHQP
jgi:hypothetical protein